MGSNPSLPNFSAAAGGGAKVRRLGFPADHTNVGRLRYHSATTWIAAKGLPAAWGRICY